MTFFLLLETVFIKEIWKYTDSKKSFLPHETAALENFMTNIHPLFL
jgi:hypothetical protein